MADQLPLDAPAPADESPGDVFAALDAARPSGPAAQSPRWLRIEALARRTAAHQGALRARLQVRLHTLLAGWQAAPPPLPAAEPAAHVTLRASGLRPLLDALAHPASAPRTALPDLPAAAPALPELKAVQQHRDMWTRLRAEQRVAQSQTALPSQAGPMNSQLLLHRALTLMRETAPGYLSCFMSQVDALMWLERAQTAAARSPAAKPPARAKAPRAGKRAAR